VGGSVHSAEVVVVVASDANVISELIGAGIDELGA